MEEATDKGINDTDSKTSGDENNKKENKEILGTEYRLAQGLSTSEAIKKEKELLTNLTETDKERIEKYLPKWDTTDEKNKSSITISNLTDKKQRRFDRRSKSVHYKEKSKQKKQILETRRLENAIQSADAEQLLQTEDGGYLEPENEMEKTFRVKQNALKRGGHLDENTCRQIYDLKLDTYGPYGMKYTNNGRFGVLYGARGHVALMDCEGLRLETEFHVKENVKDGVFLHNESLFALAQQRNVYIYDKNGCEIHMLKDHVFPNCLEYLPYHWLLASMDRAGILRYHDTSTGELVSTHLSKMGSCKVMRQNPQNAIIHCGHHNGVVSLWSPASNQFLVKTLCHNGPVNDIAIHQNGITMVTTGVDQTVKIWDARMWKETHRYESLHFPATSIDISQRGVLGVGHGSHVTFWPKDALTIKVTRPYMYHKLIKSQCHTLRFRSFQDVAGIGHTTGYSSLVIPGSGEPNLDSTEYHLNPYQDKQQRREAEVKSLLDKLSPDMITLHSNALAPALVKSTVNNLSDDEYGANKDTKQKKATKEKAKTRGRSKLKRKLSKKQQKYELKMAKKKKELMEKESKGSNHNMDINDTGESKQEDSVNHPIALQPDRKSVV